MKITKVYNHFKIFEKIFCCPICSTQMFFKNENSLICKENHCFDLSKYGYINFIPNQKKAKYTKELFECRRFIFNEGFYDPLIDNINKLIDDYSCLPLSINILDIGCGEGFFTSTLLKNTKQLKEIFAIDILKDAIILAAKENHKIKWMVGDLSNIPLQSNSIDILINILSPANYNEFKRVMKDSGILLKVIPGKYYLIELRENVQAQLINKQYSNEQTLNYFTNNMILLDKIHLFYQLPVTNLHIENFIKMTPMMFGVNTDEINQSKIKHITIDVEIVIGKTDKN